MNNISQQILLKNEDNKSVSEREINNLIKSMSTIMTGKENTWKSFNYFYIHENTIDINKYILLKTPSVPIVKIKNGFIYLDNLLVDFTDDLYSNYLILVWIYDQMLFSIDRYFFTNEMIREPYVLHNYNTSNINFIINSMRKSILKIFRNYPDLILDNKQIIMYEIERFDELFHCLFANISKLSNI